MSNVSFASVRRSGNSLGSFHREVGLANPPAFIEHKNMRFLIMDAPSDASLHMYLKEFQKYSVTDVVRLCNPTYEKERLESQGIMVHEMVFPDGDPPPQAILQAFFALCRKRFDGVGASSETAPNATIAVHCVAGLGRAPVLVAAALVEQGLDPFDAVELIRSQRKGALNGKQIAFLEKFATSKGSKCTIQ